MKGECDGRELAPGALVSVGAGGISGHSREGDTGRIEAGVKGEHQDIATRSLQVPAVTQGNGTRGFTVAELTKMDNVTTAKGNLPISSDKDSAIGSFRVPSFKEEGQQRPLGNQVEAGVQGGSEERVTGSIKIPTIMKEGWDLSAAADITRVNHDITSGNLQLVCVKGEDQGNGTRTLNVTKGGSQKIIPGEGMQSSSSVTSSVMDTKGENQKSAAEIPSMAATKRVNQDGVTLEVPSETGIKRLKKDGAAGTSDMMDGQKVSENNATDLLNIAAVKRVSQDGAIGMPGVTDTKRIRQDNLTETTMARENQNSAPETVNSAQFKKLNENSTTRTGCVETIKPEDQDSALTMVNAANAKKVNQGTGTEDLQVETVTEGKQDSTMNQGDTAVKEYFKGNSVKSSVSVLMQEKHNIGTEGLKIPVVDAASQVHPMGNPPVLAMNKKIPETTDRDKENSGMPGIKYESQDSPTGRPSVPTIKREGQDKGTDTVNLAIPQQCSEGNSERKQENLMKDDEKNVAKECQGHVSEGKVHVHDSSGSSKTKPEMVSTETQCDGSGMSLDNSVKDEYAFLIEDGGEPGECLGGCEPGKKPHKCCQCDTSFRTPYELSRHCRVHTGERPYQCRLCHRCFKRKDHVEVHTRRHVEDRRHACNECGVCFVTSSCLLRHQRRTHQAPGTKRLGEGENGEGEGEAGDIKGDGKDQPASKDAQKNGRRNKKNKPDSTYRPGGKTVCIIKKRNLRQRSYSFVELEDDVECFESDEEDRIPFLKVQEQRREEEHEDTGGQTGQLEHSLFPASLFNPEASLSHLILLGEVSRMLSHSLIPGPPDGPGSQASMGTQVGRTWGPPQEEPGDSDDSDCDPPLVACDVTFIEADGEVAGLSLPDDGPAAPQPEEATPKAEQDKVTPKSGLLQAATKTGPSQATLKARPCHTTSGTKEVHCTTNPPAAPAKDKTATTTQPGSKPPCTSPTPGKPVVSATNNKVGGTGVGAMGVPRTAWVVPANNTKGKNTCDACRRRNEANRLAQAERERQALAAQAALKKGGEKTSEDTPKGCQTRDMTKAAAASASPAKVTPSHKPQESKPAINKRGRKPGSTKKRRAGKAGGEGGGAAAVPQRPHKCHLCPFNFRSATELKRHASTHSGERPFLCELCGAGFMRKCHLQLHVRRHSGERRHACQECRMRFFTPSDLARHQAIHQAGDKPLECHLCHLTFRRAFHLERHIRRHNEAAPFACKLCGAFFSSAAALRSHDKHHRTPGPHACPDCTAAFTTATALSRHRRVHSARHHRLLRAIERHATAKSSYECVSSEGSPLSLVIRKVAAAAGGPGEGGAEPAENAPDGSTDLADKDKEEKEEEETERDKITSGLSTTDKETEGRKTEEDEKPSSNPSTTDNETEGKVEGSEKITSNPSAPDKTKEDRENITSNPSITDNIKDDREKITCSPSATGREKEGSEKNTSKPSKTEKVKERKVDRRVKIIPTRSYTYKESRIEKEMNSSNHGEKIASLQENPSVYGPAATDSQEGIKREADSSGAINLSASSNSKAGKDMVINKEESVFPSTNGDKEMGNKTISSLSATIRETEQLEESGSKNGCSPTKETRLVSNEELNSKPDLGLSPMSKERKEAQERSSCSLLLPTSREMEAVKEEIHCRTTYQLAAPSGDQEEALHSGSGYPSEQEGGKDCTEDSGQKGDVREGVTTNS